MTKSDPSFHKLHMFWFNEWYQYFFLAKLIEVNAVTKNKFLSANEITNGLYKKMLEGMEGYVLIHVHVQDFPKSFIYEGRFL